MEYNRSIEYEFGSGFENAMGMDIAWIALSRDHECCGMRPVDSRIHDGNLENARFRIALIFNRNLNRNDRPVFFIDRNRSLDFEGDHNQVRLLSSGY